MTTDEAIKFYEKIGVNSFKENLSVLDTLDLLNTLTNQDNKIQINIHEYKDLINGRLA